MKIEIPCWSQTFNLKKSKPKDKGQGYFFYLGENSDKKYQSIIEQFSLDYQKNALLENTRETIHFYSAAGPVWIQRRSKKLSESHGGTFQESIYSQTRDGFGALVGSLRALQIKRLDVEFWGASEVEVKGGIVGFDLGAYQFRAINESKGANSNLFSDLPQLNFTFEGKEIKLDWIKKAQSLSFGINWARHLINLPGHDLNPESFESIVKNQFKKSKSIKVTVWDEERLKKEGMGLHLAVGKGSQYPPRLIHLKYRPKSSKKKPIAIVGKGITFDTGGLDLKPSSGMRLMKKDMGGSAAAFGLGVWLDQVEPAIPCDIYLAIAENAVGPQSFRPGDICKARNGLTVEIHNTDAEGRLVLADAIDVAIKATEKPVWIIDIATLTGAIKGALGADIPGLFANNDHLADKILKVSQEAGETAWRMPLVPKYAAQMNSTVAHMTNAVDGFGGAITAALFLERFVGNIPWAHLDIYSWADKAQGGIMAGSGTGQGVQTLALLLESLSK